jgi:hypothetical protein
MKSALNCLAIAAILAACPAGSAATDLTLDISSSGPALKGERWSRAYVAQGDLRADLNCEGADRTPTLILLYHQDPEQATILDVKKKTYWVVDRETRDRLIASVTAAMEQLEPQLSSLPDEQRQMVEQMMQGMKSTPSPAAIEVRKTERQEKIDGQPCVVWETLSGGAVVGETWVTSWQTAKAPKGALDVYGSLIRFMDPLTSFVPQVKEEIGGAVRGLETIDGFPLRTKSLRNGEVVMETRIAVVDRKAHSASVFEVPAGYTQESLPVAK